MSVRKAKSSAKLFVSDQDKLKKIVLSTMKKISDIVGATLGPGGKNILIESDIPGIPNKNTKDGVTVFKSLGASNSYEHLVIEQTRDSAQRTASEAGDGTTTATILSAAMVENLYNFCSENPKFSPQKVARDLAKVVRTQLVPIIREKAIIITEDNMDLLRLVAKISANGDDDMADAVIKAFDLLGYGENAHVTIKEVSGPYGYDVGLIEGFPMSIGYEESMGKFHTVFINDQGNQRCTLDNPKFLLFDGQINDLVTLQNLTEKLHDKYIGGDTGYKSTVIFAHGYSDSVLTALAYNFTDPGSINVVPMVTPRAPFANSQTHFLGDLAAFTGAKVFGMKDSLANASLEDLGSGMTNFECYRFRSTIVGDSDPVNVEVRAEELATLKKTAESEAERIWLEERLGKLTSGIAKLTILGGSNGELKEAHDRCEDAVCAVRAAISKGALPGGCRVLLDLFLYAKDTEDISIHVKSVLMPSLLAPITRLLNNAGLQDADSEKIITKLLENPETVYDVENQEFGTAEELGVFDSLPAVEQALKNATSIATVMGTLGGLIAYPRDDAFERSEAAADAEMNRMVENPTAYKNEADERI